MIKLLAIAADIDPNNLGGAEHHFVEVLKRIAPKIESAKVVLGKDLSLSAQFKNWPQIKFVAVDYPRVTNFCGLLYIVYALPVVLKLNDYNVIWGKQEYPQGVIAAILKTLKPGIKFYLTSQSDEIHKNELVVKGQVLHKFQNIFSMVVEPLIRFAFRKADVVGAVSLHSARLAREYGAKNVVVVPNGVNLEKYKVHKIRKVNKVFKIITTSSLIPRNGIDTLIEACKSLDFNFELLIAGDGPEKNKLELLMKNYKLQNKIKFLGRVPSSKIPSLLYTSDLFVRPSRAEGFGSSFIEAMAAAVPVIGTPVGGITDFLINNETGLLVAPNDPVGLSMAIKQMCANPSLARKFSSNAYKLVERKFVWGKIAGQVLGVFRLITDEK